MEKFEIYEIMFHFEQMYPPVERITSVLLTPHSRTFTYSMDGNVCFEEILVYDSPYIIFALRPDCAGVSITDPHLFNA